MNKINNKKPNRKNITNAKVRKSSNTKITVILVVWAFLFIVIAFRLLQINLVNGEDLTRKALNQLTSSKSIKADRGIIYDRNKKELAINITKANVYYYGNFNKKNKKDIEKIISEDSSKIASVLEVDKDQIIPLIKKEKINLIARDVPREKAIKLKELKMVNLSVEDTQRRFYPYRNLASEIIGFVNQDGDGQYGIESKYDDELSGIAGKDVAIKNIYSSKIPFTDEESYAPKEGLYPVLTIDESIQQFAYNAVMEGKKNTNAQKVSAIVQETKTGEILAMAESDSYDLNNPKAPVGEEIEFWDDLSQEDKTDYWFKNWLNYSVSSQFEPGSTFKLVTAAAALEEDTTSPSKTYNCPGKIQLAKGVTISCTSHRRGAKTMEDAVAESCNLSFISMGKELGATKFYKYIESFGFGEKTGIDLPAEAKGQIPETAKDITPVRLATMSYGHGIATTPIQLINSVSAISNGGYLNTPRVVDRLEDSNGNIIKKFEKDTKRRVISQKTSDTMRKLMEKVVTDGTGKRASVAGYRIGGKTGTANVVSKTGGYKDSYNASFVGVAPINDPKITVLVIVEQPKGDYYAATVAAPIAQKILKNTLEYLNLPKTEKIEDSIENKKISVPNVEGLLLKDAGKKLVDAGLTFNSNSKNSSDVSTVISQSISPGIEVEDSRLIELMVNDNDKKEKIMPYLIGKSANEAKNILKGLNIEYNIIGSGEVVSQSIKAKEKLKQSSKITLTMSIPAKEDKNSEELNSDNKNSSRNTDESLNNKNKEKGSN